MSLSIRILIINLFFVAMLLFAFSNGQYALSLRELWQQITTMPSMLQDSRNAVVFWQIRLPRIIAAILIGAALSAAGAAYQGMFRNPLVSPDILGVSAGAGLGAITGLYFGLAPWQIQLLAFVGGLLVVALVLGVGHFARRLDPVLSLVLVGIALGSLFNAGISLLKVLADPYTQLPSITFWLLGGLNTIQMNDIYNVLPPMLLGLMPLILLRWRMNLLSLSDDEARTMGINIQQTRLLFIISATLITASAVSIAGIIAWVGLVIAHITRLLVGPNFAVLLPTSLVIGASFLLLTDTLARSLFIIELPLSILTSCIGAPFFLFLLMRGR